jgi:hypothetical protein
MFCCVLHDFTPDKSLAGHCNDLEALILQHDEVIDICQMTQSGATSASAKAAIARIKVPPVITAKTLGLPGRFNSAPAKYSVRPEDVRPKDARPCDDGGALRCYDSPPKRSAVARANAGPIQPRNLAKAG